MNSKRLSKKISKYVPFFILLLLIFLLMLSALNCYAFDIGAGGIFFGVSKQQNLLKFLPSNSNPLNYYGGYGYGILGNYIIGGFGLAILNESIYTGGDGFAGGFGGFVSGFQLINTYVLEIDIIWWFGLGGIGVSETEGYFALYNEFTVELGLRLAFFAELFFYVGYQYVGNLIPGPAFDFSNYTMTLGFRIAFGS